MDLYDILMKDHRTVEDIFEKIDNSGKRAFKTRQQLFDKLRMELELHTRLEERIVYPDFKKHPGTEKFVGESLEEHGEVKRMLRDLGRMSPEAAEWPERIAELKKAVMHHVDDEEGKIFPVARKEIPDEEAEKLAKRVAEMKEKARA